MKRSGWVLTLTVAVGFACGGALFGRQAGSTCPNDEPCASGLVCQWWGRQDNATTCSGVGQTDKICTLNCTTDADCSRKDEKGRVGRCSPGCPDAGVPSPVCIYN